MHHQAKSKSKWKDIHKWIIRYSDEKPNLLELSTMLQYQSVNEPTPCGSLPLHLAALGQQKYILAFLIPRTLDINHQNKNGCTALHYACRAGNLDNVILLVTNEAKCDITDNGKIFFT